MSPWRVLGERLGIPYRWRVEGAFDTSYSLALVNRRLALALDARGVPAELFSTEGPGDFAPNEEFLAQHPAVAALRERGRERRQARVVMRNLWPPRVTDMNGAFRVLASYGWEESEYPADHAVQFNRHLDLITTTSTYVARVLAANGIHVPMAAVGNGIDHWSGVAAEPADVPTLGSASFRFLHVSSCFPRKGLDVLLEAWGRAFTRADDVCLVVKTFPNPHNEAPQQIDALRQRHPDHAEIVLINRDLPDGAMVTLYRRSDAVVIPSRGEGYGLPVGEAMWFERPVITTAHGGPLDFADDETAWLVDYRFGYAATHMGLFDSVWAEPDIDDLVRALRTLRDPASAEERRRRVALARRRIALDYSWDAVAQRTQAAVAAARRGKPRLPRVAWLAPAIATEASHNLAGAIPPDRRADITACTHAVMFHPGPGFGAALAALLHRGIEVSVICADARDLDEALQPALLRCRRLLVATLDELNHLKNLGLAANGYLFATTGDAEPPTAAIAAVLPHDAGPDTIAKTVGAYRDAHQWDHLARRLWNVLRAPPMLRV